jgi:hypothetical protein
MIGSRECGNKPPGSMIGELRNVLTEQVYDFKKD